MHVQQKSSLQVPDNVGRTMDERGEGGGVRTPLPEIPKRLPVMVNHYILSLHQGFVFYVLGTL